MGPFDTPIEETGLKMSALIRAISRLMYEKVCDLFVSSNITVRNKRVSAEWGYTVF